MPDRDALAEIKANLARARNLELEIEDFQSKLASASSELNDLVHRVLPDQFNAAGVTRLSLEADGNLPAFDATLRPYFKANIPAKWDDERRAEAMAELDRFGAGDLARRTISVTFPRSDDGASELAKKLDALGYLYSMQFELPWQTLTSWLKETVTGGQMPDLEKIGGQVGQVVNLKKVSE